MLRDLAMVLVACGGLGPLFTGRFSRSTFGLVVLGVLCAIASELIARLGHA